MKKKTVRLKFGVEVIKGFGVTVLKEKGSTGHPMFSLLIGCVVFSVERIRNYAVI